MSAILIPSRRGVIAGLASLFAAPAIVSASSLMPVKALEPTLIRANQLLTPEMITREAVKLFYNSNLFLQNINQQYDESFGVDGAKIGMALRVRLPDPLPQHDWAMMPSLFTRYEPPMLDLPAPLAVAAGVAAVAHANPELSRRSLFGLRGA